MSAVENRPWLQNYQPGVPAEIELPTESLSHMAMDSVDILRQDGGEEIRVYVSQTEDELEGMERYEAQQ